MILLVYLVILAAYLNIALALVVAFFLGILKNVWLGETIGTASLIYISVVYAIHLYTRKFNSRAIGFLFFASIIIIMLTEVIESGNLSFSQIQFMRAIGTSFVIVLLFKVIYTLWGSSTDERKLPV